MKQKKPEQVLLLDVPEHLSPKLLFLRAHNLATKRTSNSRWRCDVSNAPKPGVGRNEEDAIIDWCQKNKINHYNIE